MDPTDDLPPGSMAVDDAVPDEADEFPPGSVPEAPEDSELPPGSFEAPSVDRPGPNVPLVQRPVFGPDVQSLAERKERNKVYREDLPPEPSDDDLRLEAILHSMPGPGDGGLEKQAATYKLAKQTGVAPDVIAADFDKIANAWASAQAYRTPKSGEPYKPPAQRFREEQPELAKVLLRDPTLGWVLKDKKVSALHKAWNAAADFTYDAPIVGMHNMLPDEVVEELKKEREKRDKPEQELVLDDEKAKEIGSGWYDTGAGAGKKGSGLGGIALPKRFAIPFLRAKETWEGLNISTMYTELAARRAVGADTAAHELKILKAEQDAVRRNYDEGAVGQVFTDAAEGLASSSQMMLAGGAAGVAVGVPVAAAALAITRSPATASAAGLRAGSVAAHVGASLGTFNLEFGSAYKEMSNAVARDGRPAMDNATATTGAAIYATLATGIEFASWGPMFRAMGPLGALISTGDRAAFTEALVRNPAFMATVKRAAKGMLGTGLAEGGEEMLQDATQQAVEMFARAHGAAKGGAFDFSESRAPNLDQSLEAFGKGAVGGLAGGVVSANVDLVTQHLFRDKALVDGNKLRAVAGLADSPVAADAPQVIVDMFAEHTAQTGSPATHAYVDAKSLTRLFQDEGADADQGVTRLMGPDGPKKLEEASATGGRLQVPMLDYVEKWVPSGLAARLVNDTSTSEAGLTTRQAKALNLEKLADELNEEQLAANEESTAGSQFDKVEAEMVTSGRFTPKEASRNLSIWRAFVRTMSTVFEKPAAKLFEQYQVRFNPDGDQAQSLELGAPSASRYLSRAWAAMTPAEKLTEQAIDRETGILNARSFARLKGPQTSVFSVEGIKYENDKYGHRGGDSVYRAAAQALAKHVENVAKVKGDFAAKSITTQAQLEEVLAKVNAEPALQGYRVTGALGASLRAASAAHNEAKSTLEQRKERAKRGERPLFATKEFATAPLEKVSGTKVPDAVRADFEKTGTFEETYVDPDSGLLNKDGYAASPPARFQASADLDNLRDLNLLLGEEQVDEGIKFFSNLLRQLGAHEFSGAKTGPDEYNGKSDDENALRAFFNKAQQIAERVEVPVVLTERQAAVLKLKPGPAVLTGLHFSFGVGQDLDHAEHELLRNKAEREAAGLRGEGAVAARVVQRPAAGSEGDGNRTGEGDRPVAPGPGDAQVEEDVPLEDNLDESTDFGRQRFFDAGRLEQDSVALREGREKLPGLGKTNNTRDIAIELEKRTRKQSGAIDRKDFSDAAAAKIAKHMLAELEFEFRPENRGKSGVGWYSEKWQAALDRFGEVFPELKKNKQHRDLFTALVAITSDGQKVYTNFKSAAALWKAFRESGFKSLPEDLIKSQRGGMGPNLQRINKMLAEQGPKKMHEFLLGEHTVSQLKKTAKEQGTEFNSNYKADQVLPMAAIIFGPKLGAFYANLMGADGYLTMDRWWSRTFNRYRGQLIPAATSVGMKRFKELLGDPEMDDFEAMLLSVDYRNAYEAKDFKNGTVLEKAANTIYKAEFEELEDTPFNAGDREFMIRTTQRAQELLREKGHDVSLADIQAILWYYEKRLYAELGARSSADVSYQEVAGRVADELQGKTAEEPGGDRPEGQKPRSVRKRAAVGPDGAEFEWNPVDEGIGGTDEERRADLQRRRGLKKSWLEQGSNEPFTREQLTERLSAEGFTAEAASVARGASPMRRGDWVFAAADPLSNKGTEALISVFRQPDAQGKAEGRRYFPRTEQGLREALSHAGLGSTRTRLEQFPTPEESLENQKHELVLRDLLVEGGLKALDDTKQVMEMIDKAVAVYRAKDPKAPLRFFAVFKRKRRTAEKDVPYATRSFHTDEDFRAFVAKNDVTAAWVEPGLGYRSNYNYPTREPTQTRAADHAAGGGPAVNAMLRHNGEELRSLGLFQSSDAFTESLVPSVHNKSGFGEKRDGFWVENYEGSINPDYRKGFDDAVKHYSDFDARAAEANFDGKFTTRYWAGKTPVPQEYRDGWQEAVDQFNQEFHPAISRKGEDVREAFPPESKNLEGQAAAEQGTAVGTSTLLKRIAEADAPAKGKKSKPTPPLRLDQGGAIGGVISSERLEAPKDQGVPRGYTDVLKNGMERVFEIALNKNADMSTWLHESGHVFLEVLGDLSERGDVPARVKQQWEATLKYLGVENREAIKREHHEKFARAFEAYLFEGKAPSAKLAGAFERFKTWLKKVYRDIRGLNVELNDEIRTVFDRLLATDDEIARQTRRQGQRKPMAQDLAGMGDAEYAEYKADYEEALSHVQQQVDLRVLKDRLRENESWWKEEHAKETDLAAGAYEQLPARVAQNYLRGKDPRAGFATSLDKAAVVELVGVKGAKSFRTRKDGEHPDEVASFLGYPTGRAMLEDILALQPKAAWVKATSLEQMAEKHPDVLQDREKLRDLVSKGLHGDRTLKWLLKEWVALKKKITPPGAPMWSRQTAPVEALQLAAKKWVERTAIGQLSPNVVLQREREAADNAAKLAAKGDFGQAFVAKQEQVLNMYRWRELTAAREQREKFLELAASLLEKPAQARLGKASPVYRDGVRTVLEAIGLAEVNPQATAVGFGELTQQLEADGQTIGFDVEALDAISLKQGGSYKQLTVAEMRAVDALLKSVSAAATNKNTVLYGEKRLDAEEHELTLLADSAAHGPPDLPPLAASRAGEGPWRSFSNWVAGADGSLLRPEVMLRWMGDSWVRTFVDPLQKAKHYEAKLLKETIKPVVDAFKAARKSVSSRFDETIDGKALFPGFGPKSGQAVEAPTKRFELLMMVLHMGTESSLFRLLDGWGITLPQMQKAIDLLTKEELQWVQSIWDAAEGLWPLASDLEERDTGLRPEKLEHRALVTQHGTFNGGYFPAVYDYRVEQAGERQAAKEIADLMDPSFTRPGTARSHLKSRVDGFSGALALDAGTIARGLTQTAHDIAYREALKSVGNMLLRPAIQAELRTKLGERAEQFLPWLKDVGTQRGVEGSIKAQRLLNLVKKLRGNTVVAVLGYSIPTAAGDIGNLFTAVPRSGLKMKHWGAGILEFWSNPFEKLAEARALSGELGTRADSLLRDFSKQSREITASGAYPLRAFRWFKDHAFAFMEFTDAITSTPVWLGAYRQGQEMALERGLEGDAAKREAIRFADSVVRDSFPSHNAVDAPGILRDKGFIGQSLMFYGYFSVVYNSIRDLVHPLHTQENLLSVDGAKTIAQVSGRLLAFMSASVVLSELVAGRGPEDDEDWASWYLRKLLVGGLSSTPLLGDAAVYTEGKLMKKHTNPRASAAVSIMNGLGDGFVKLKGGEADEKLAKQLMQSLAPPIGFPLAQPLRTATGIKAQTEDPARNAFELGSDLAYGRRQGQGKNPLSIAGETWAGKKR